MICDTSDRKFDVIGFRSYLRGLVGTKKKGDFAREHDVSPEHLSRLLNSDRVSQPSKKLIKKLAGGNQAIYIDMLTLCGYEIDADELGETDNKPPVSMDARSYQLQAARTINPGLRRDEIEAHALWGLAAEVGELQGIYQKHYQGHPFEPEHAKRELGDILWMIAEYCTAMGWDMADVMQTNLDKLQSRYPDGFDPEHSLHREEGDV